MATTLNSSGVQFPDGTTQTTAATSGLTTQVFTSSGTFTMPSGKTTARVYVIGGSGGNACFSGYSGGFGGAAEVSLTGLSGSYSVTVGAGGTGIYTGTTGATAGSGGTSSFGSLVSCTGGSGGKEFTGDGTNGTPTISSGTTIFSSASTPFTNFGSSTVTANPPALSAKQSYNTGSAGLAALQNTVNPGAPSIRNTGAATGGNGGMVIVQY